MTTQNTTISMNGGPAHDEATEAAKDLRQEALHVLCGAMTTLQYAENALYMLADVITPHRAEELEERSDFQERSHMLPEVLTQMGLALGSHAQAYLKAARALLEKSTRASSEIQDTYIVTGSCLRVLRLADDALKKNAKAAGYTDPWDGGRPDEWHMMNDLCDQIECVTMDLKSLYDKLREADL